MDTTSKVQRVLYGTARNTPVYALLNYSLSYLNSKNEINKNNIIQQHAFMTLVYPECLTTDIDILLKEILK